MSTVVGAVAHVKLQREAADGQNSPTFGKAGAIKLQLSAEQLVDIQAWLDRALQQWLEPIGTVKMIHIPEHWAVAVILDCVVLLIGFNCFS